MTKLLSPAPSWPLSQYDLQHEDGYDSCIALDFNGEYVKYEDAMYVIREQQAALKAAYNDEPGWCDLYKAVLTKWEIKP